MLNRKIVRNIGLAAIFSVASGTGGFAENETIAVFTKNSTNPYFLAIRVGAEGVARSLGVKVIQYVPTKPDSIPEQISQLEDVITKRPDAIVFVPVDFKALVSTVEKVNAANIPIVNVTDKLTGGKTIGFVGANDRKIGYQTAKQLFAAMKGQGNVVVLEGIKGSSSAADRVAGFMDAVAENPGIKVLASQTANYQRLNGLQVTENLLQSHPKIDAILAASDSMAMGAIEALEGADRKALVVGLNGTQEAVEAIKTGKLFATGTADPFLQGCLGARIAIDYLRHKPVPSEAIFIPVVVIDGANVAKYDVPLEKRSCPELSEIIGK
jgi:ribose transport system substrate-binding protein